MKDLRVQVNHIAARADQKLQVNLIESRQPAAGVQVVIQDQVLPLLQDQAAQVQDLHRAVAAKVLLQVRVAEERKDRLR